MIRLQIVAAISPSVQVLVRSDAGEEMKGGEKGGDVERGKAGNKKDKEER